MRTIKSALKALWKEEDGLTTVEYAIAGGLVGAAVILAFTDLGSAVGRIINGIVTDLGGP
jgi:pilus assembly protein Flp/PilA